MDDGRFPVMGAAGAIGRTNRANAKAESIIIGRVGTAGAVNRVRTDCWASDNTIVATPGPNLTPPYAFYLLLGARLPELASKTAQPLLTASSIGNQRFWIPGLEEQRRIADFLDAETARIDQLRSLTQRQMALVRERFNEQMRTLTTDGAGQGIETRVSWMPRVNREWNLSRVSYEFTTSSGTTPTSSHADYFDGSHPWVNSSDIKDAPIRFAAKHVSDAALADFSALKLCRAGSLVVALYGQGATKGRVGILQMDACLNQACCALTSLGRISEEFAYYWFRAHKEGIVTRAVGAGQPNLSQELIRQLRIPVPGAETQEKIVAELSGAEEQLRTHSSLLQRRDALLAERRQTLITAAVTGQFDVTTASGRNVTEGVAV
ncbi:restriction endonuclease subunit S [Streptomyces hirsutus]|uniref:restriction endonuclease subunit S n=1 Tax=Streptomyces hirsutus TaxID=35620 RepID=UPI00331EBAD3